MTREHEPNEVNKHKVIAFSCAGYTHEEIARYLEIDDKTLRKHYREELDKAQINKIGQISDVAYRMALNGDQKMIEFVLKCRGRWSYYKPPEDDTKKSTTDTLLEKLIDKL